MKQCSGCPDADWHMESAGGINPDNDTQEKCDVIRQKEAYQKRKWKIDAYISSYLKTHRHPLIYANDNPFVLSTHIAECFVLRIVRFFTLEWDPYDVTDPCNSLEEKQEDYCNHTAADMHYYSEMPRYAIEYAIFVGINGRKDIAWRFGQLEGKDKYSYVMPDELWETIKKIIKWEGKKRINC